MHGRNHARTGTVLRFSLVATLLYVVLTVVAGVRANSLALLSEAGHNFSDFLALLLSWVAVYLQSLPPDSTKTYGYHRAGVLAALINAISLVVISGFIFYEALHRLHTPQEVQPKLMIIVAAIGVIMNGVIALLLRSSSRDVNIRSAFIHQIGDTLSTAAVILGGVAILLTGQRWVDPALSLVIGVLILWSSISIIRETLNILLEGTPRGIHLDEILREIRLGAGVEDVHDLHVWSIGSEVHALSCHIRIADIPPSESERILRAVNDRLRERFHIYHTTIQFEAAVCNIAHGCVMPVSAGEAHAHDHDHEHHEHNH